MQNLIINFYPFVVGWEVSERVKNGLWKLENMIDVGITLFMLFCGIIYLSQALKLLKTKELFPSNILYPNNLGPDSCKKPQEFIKFMAPRMIIVGVLFVGFAILTGWMFVYGQMNTVLYDCILMGPPLLILVYYMSCVHRAAFAFWR